MPYFSYTHSQGSPASRRRRVLGNPKSPAHSASQSKHLRNIDVLEPSLGTTSIFSSSSSSSSGLPLSTLIPPAVNVLPTELLTYIFALCLPSTLSVPTPSTAPLLLCQICAFWRRLARGTPLLWVRLDLGNIRPPAISTYPVEHSSKSSNGKLPLNLTSLVHLYTTLALPIPLREFRIVVSRYRWAGVKTDWERGMREWTVERPLLNRSDISSRPSTPSDLHIRLSARDVLENVLLRSGACERMLSLDVEMDDLEDIPRIEYDGPTSSPSHNFSHLHSLNLRLPHLALSDLPFSIDSFLPIPTQLRIAVNHIQMALGWKSSDGHGWGCAFGDPLSVQELKEVEVDTPWVALVPSRYVSPSRPASPFRLSLLPYGQLTRLTISRPIPRWLFRALLVECTCLQSLCASVVHYHRDTGVGGEVQEGGDDGLNAECYEAFGVDPIEFAWHESDAVDTQGRSGDGGGLDRRGEMWVLQCMEEMRLTLGARLTQDERVWVRRVRRAARVAGHSTTLAAGLVVGGRAMERGDDGVGSWKDIEFVGEMDASAENEAVVECTLGGFGFIIGRFGTLHVQFSDKA
ncbi:hypothetical protein DFP72DRAFT_933139 [Ephemerocybe angulata]|uniref:F-box domain-containing protein n=1 Tax=Ephemerocybe angulata TaxID=980116 RepID=A0A8H6LTP6_9AGAR|nr:hypothetical protein DFP72DRAFT_933139 [Tulosesus angulatus]